MYITSRCFNGVEVFSGKYLFSTEWSQNSLVVSKELESHPAPEVEEDIDRDGDWQQQTVETQTVAAGTALGEILIHRSRVEQTKEGHYWDQSHHYGQGKHTCQWVLISVLLD